MTSHIGLTWKDFLTKPWTTERVGLDLNATNATKCKQDFKYNEVNSCYREPLPEGSYAKIQYSNNQPFYELKRDGSGEPFANIMELRSAKIRNFLQVKYYQGIADLWPIQYEYMLHEGTEPLITRLEEITGLKRNCEAVPAQDNRPSRPLSVPFIEYVDYHLDWSAEKFIGYSRKVEKQSQQMKLNALIAESKFEEENENEDEDIDG